MKQQSRNGVFETNSSSIHTISIYNNDDYKENMKNATRVWFGSGEYGWGEDVYTCDASYLWTAIVTSGRYNHEQIQLIKNSIADILIKNNIDYEFEPYKVVTYEDGSNGYCTFDDWSYIDHTEDLWDFLDYIVNIDYTVNEEHLLRYLFNSYVCTGNDNCDSGYEIMKREKAKDGITLFVKGN